MSEIKPVYQSRNPNTVYKDGWTNISPEVFERRKGSPDTFETRILYPAADYEALKEKLARLNGLYHSEVSKHQLDYNALKAENEAQAKRIAELEDEDKISDGTIKLCSTILAKIAITLKGEPMELARHGYHDLPELVSVLHLENELNKVQIDEMLTAMRRAVLALAFAAESSRAMKDDYNALSAAIDKAASKNGDSK